MPSAGERFDFIKSERKGFALQIEECKLALGEMDIFKYCKSVLKLG